MITNLYAVVEADCSSLIKTSSWTKSLSEHVFVVVLQMLSIDEIQIIKKKIFQQEINILLASQVSTT